MTGLTAGTRWLCPTCGAAHWSETLVLARSGDPPGEPGHLVDYSHSVVFACRECSAQVLELRHHDCFEHDSIWDQYEWYWLTKEGASQLVQALGACPAPTDPTCSCRLHEDLRKSASRLPAEPWRSSLEADSHLHRVTLAQDEGRLRWEPAG